MPGKRGLVVCDDDCGSSAVVTKSALYQSYIPPPTGENSFGNSSDREDDKKETAIGTTWRNTRQVQFLLAHPALDS